MIHSKKPLATISAALCSCGTALLAAGLGPSSRFDIALNISSVVTIFIGAIFLGLSLSQDQAKVK